MAHLLESRRKFLKQSFSGFIILTAAGVIPPGVARHGSSATLRFFSMHEYLLVNALAERIVGPTTDSAIGDKVDVAGRADQFLAEEDPEIQRQIHLLLALFGSPLSGLLFNFTYTRFLDMAPNEQDAHLTGWMNSSLAFRRTAFVALKRLCLSMYYSDEHSWSEIHYTGMFMPGERP